MIFLGDTAHPFATPPRWETPPWLPQPVVVNLEGALNDDLSALRSHRLFNHSSILNALQAYGTKAVCLANNHVMDFPQSLMPTINVLRSRGMVPVGAGENSEAAGQAVRIQDGSETYALFAFGWRPIQCRPASRSRPGVNPLDPESMLSAIRSYREKSPGDHIVLLMHWNYDMELYPQPAHRELALAAIDAGAELVVGHHPHRVGGIEFHRGKPIVYSIGNWWLPQGVFFGGTMRYQKEAELQLAVEWSPKEGATCHWFKFDSDRCGLQHLQSEKADRSQIVRDLTPFSGMRYSDYQRWFGDNRIKRRWFLPIYYDYRCTRLNTLKDRFVLTRHAVLRLAEMTGLRRAAAICASTNLSPFVGGN
jgi:hypothetical protein